MTKRDFEFLSRTLKWVKVNRLTAHDDYAYEMVVRELSHALRAAAGPKFDVDRFRVDCGLNP